MTPPVAPAELQGSALRLYRYLLDSHWDGEALKGPDPGVRFNARFFRFAKSYTRFVGWNDQRVYAQAQKYWIEANVAAIRLGLVDDGAVDVVRRTADYLREAQTEEGFWEYPNPEWADRIATVEGNYAALGLLTAHTVVPDPAYVEAAARWHDYAVEQIGFQHVGDTLAINYFRDVGGSRIPNNSASAVRTFAMLADASGDDRFLETVGPMVRFMSEVQLDSGELPYGVRGERTQNDRIHFLCFQYNAFQFLNLVEYQRMTGDGAIVPVLEGLARYLATSITEDGRARYDCQDEGPEVTYYGVACARALSVAAQLGYVAPGNLPERALRRALGHQRPNGAFTYSHGNYGVLHDVRPYPRYLAMILAHVLGELEDRR